MRERMCLRCSRPTKRPINQYPLAASPLNDANLMAGLHAGVLVDAEPTEQGGGIESLRRGQHRQGFNSAGFLHAALPNDTRGKGRSSRIRRLTAVRVPVTVAEPLAVGSVRGIICPVVEPLTRSVNPLNETTDGVPELTDPRSHQSNCTPTVFAAPLRDGDVIVEGTGR